MTQVTYNDVVIQNVLTQSVDQQPIYDTAGNVDQIYVRTLVTIKFLFHANDGSGLGVGVGNNLALGTARKLEMLNTNRRRFTMTIGGNTLFDVVPGAIGENERVLQGQITDVNHGPRPSVKVEEIIGTQVVRGTFTVELAVPSCGTPAGVVNLRWWTIDDVDENWYTVRTISGRIRVANKNISPHSVRGLIFPPLQDGFRRESMAFTEDPNGLELEFSIKDKEVYRSVPFPASTASGSHRMSSQVPGATIVESECTVKLTGAHDVPQTALIQLGVKIIDNKLQLKNQGVGSSGAAKAWLLFYAIDAALFDNVVTVMARIKHTGQGEDGFEFLPQVTKQFGKSLPADIAVGGVTYDSLKSRLLPGPTAPLSSIIESVLQTPCDPAEMPQATFITSAGDSTPEKSEESGDYPDTEGDLPKEEDKTTDYADEHLRAPYLSYRVISQIKTHHGRAAMEIAAASTASETDDVLPVDLTQGRTYRYITVRATRINTPPDMFDPIDTFVDSENRKHTLMNDSFGDNGRYKIGSVEHFWQEQSLIYLVHKKTSLRLSGFPLLDAPWIKTGDQLLKVPPDVFKKNPIESGS